MGQQMWPWILLLGIVFLISYDPGTRNLANYFDQEVVDGAASPRPHGTNGEAQKYSGPNDSGA